MQKEVVSQILRVTEKMLILFVLTTLLGFENTMGAGKSQDSIQLDRKVEQLLSRMTLAEKIGQMTQIDRRYFKNGSDIKVYNLGSLLSGGGSAPANNVASSWVDMYDDYQSYQQQGDVLALDASDYT